MSCLLLGACASPQIPTGAINRADPGAVALVESSKVAHGGKAFARVRDLSVRYEGQWGALGPRFQPVLADTGYRRSSEERLLVSARIIAQEHSGPSGRKLVVRSPAQVDVAYNGTVIDDQDQKRAAALVADAYQMFLLGPFYFNRPGVTLSSQGSAMVNRVLCDRILAVLQPGFGFAGEDRVLLFIDRSSKRLVRVRMTLNGLESTQGAEVDVTFGDHRRIGGILWATDFDERIRLPFDLHAHHWKMTGLEINRGFRSTDLSASGLKGRATPPAAPLRVRE